VHRQTIQRALRGVPPPPCGEGSGVGVFNAWLRSCLHPTPNPSPSRGGESRRRLWSRRP
jgi:hypothetical protein